MSCKYDYRQSEDNWIETWSQVSWFLSESCLDDTINEDQNW